MPKRKIVLKLDIAENNPELKSIRDKLILKKFEAKITSKNPKIKKDDRNQNEIKSIGHLDIMLNLDEKSGYLILKGTIGCSFKEPYGGNFYLVNKVEILTGSFSNQRGVPVTIQFNNSYPTDNSTIKDFLAELVKEKNFRFNIHQFDEFMEVFEFYKEISGEINNSVSYNIIDVSNTYNFIDITNTEIRDNQKLNHDFIDLEEIYNNEKIIIGYKIKKHTYQLFNNELKEKTIDAYDIIIRKTENIYKKIKKMIDNLYISNFYDMDENKIKGAKKLEIINIKETEKEIMITCFGKKPEKFFNDDEKKNNSSKKVYLNIYDFGQKIKIDSIENSLKLIERGETESSMKMIKFLIGDARIPNKTEKNKSISDYLGSEIYKNADFYIKNLNDSQKLAFLKSLDGSPVTLIKGPPGTGKTHVINSIIQFITKELNEKVIISSQTHIAIDNVLDKLMENKDIIIPNRITNRFNKYSIEEIDKTIYKTWGRNVVNFLSGYNDIKIKNKIISDIKNFSGDEKIEYSTNYNQDYSVIGATTTTSAISGKKGIELFKEYDWLIIDEVSKCPITEVLRYLPYVNKIILVGDDFQLAPNLEFTKEDVKNLKSYDEEKFDKLQNIYEESIFSKTIKKAEKSGRLILLDENYRSLKPILDSYNLFYDGKLKNLREKNTPIKVKFKENQFFQNDKHIFFVEPLGGVEAMEGYSRYNIQEIEAIAETLKKLKENIENIKAISIALIFPYAAQIKKFTEEHKDLINECKKLFKSIEIDTVDAFQGRETDIVLVSTVITRMEKLNFMKDFRRINVAISRAKDKLFIFGSRELRRFEINSPLGNKRKYLSEVIDIIRSEGRVFKFNINGGLSNDN